MDSGKKRRRPEAAPAAPVPTTAAPPTTDDPDSRTVFVSGIPYDSTEDAIGKFFVGCGDIAEIRAPRFQDSGRLMGYAHISFSTQDAAVAALKRDGAYLGERFLTVEQSKAVADGPSAALALSTKPKPAGCATIFIKGVPYEADEDAVAAVFKRFGSVVSTRLPRWGHTGKRKGHGYVQFSSEAAAGAAVAAYRAAAGTPTAITIGSRPVHLDFDDGAPRSSFKAPSGQAFYKSEEATGAPVKKKATTTPAAAAAGTGGAGKSAAAPSKPAGHYWPRAQVTGSSSSKGGAAPEPHKSHKKH